MGGPGRKREGSGKFWKLGRRLDGKPQEGRGARGGVGALPGLLSPNLNQEEHQANSGSKRIST